MKVVIVGATGTIGKAVATLLNNRGYEIVGASRHSQPSVDVNEPASIKAFYTAIDRKSTRLNSSHIQKSRMPSSA